MVLVKKIFFTALRLLTLLALLTPLTLLTLHTPPALPALLALLAMAARGRGEHPPPRPERAVSRARRRCAITALRLCIAYTACTLLTRGGGEHAPSRAPGTCGMANR